MTPPSESSSGHIDMFRVRPKPPELPGRSFPAADVVPRHRSRGYHFVQVALVTGLFACGGLICSMLLVDRSDNFLGPHFWPRKSYSSPALATPRKPVTAPTVPQRGMFKSNGDDENAVIQEHRASDRKPSIPPLSLASAVQIPECATESFQGRSGRISPEISVTTGKPSISRGILHSVSGVGRANITLRQGVLPSARTPT